MSNILKFIQFQFCRPLQSSTKISNISKVQIFRNVKIKIRNPDTRQISKLRHLRPRNVFNTSRKKTLYSHFRNRSINETKTTEERTRRTQQICSRHFRFEKKKTSRVFSSRFLLNLIKSPMRSVNPLDREWNEINVGSMNSRKKKKQTVRWGWFTCSEVFWCLSRKIKSGISISHLKLKVQIPSEAVSRPLSQYCVYMSIY